MLLFFLRCATNLTGFCASMCIRVRGHWGGSCSPVKDRLAGWTFQNWDSGLLPWFLELSAPAQRDTLPLHTVLPVLQSWKVSSKSSFFFFFFHPLAFLPSFLWVTAADLAHVHHLPKHNLSDDSSADVAQTRRTFHQSLQRPVTLTHSQPKAFLITEENYWRSGELRLPSHSLYIRSILNKYFF